VDIVFGLRSPERRWRVVAAAIIATSLHGALWAWAGLLQPSLESWSTAFSARVHAELMHVEVVELAKPPPPPAPPSPPAPTTPPPVAKPTRSAPRAEPSRPPPPAQAGAIVAQAPDPQAPVDLTGDTFVTGTADAYAGGVTAAAGTSKEAVFTQEAPPAPAPVKREEDRSRPVSLDDGDWACPWPRDAEAEELSEQVVVMKVVVRADGAAESVRLVSDPGHGFGPAAVACAMATRFEAARDREGRTVASISPALRVRFTR
jgi:protein TonB